MDPTVTIALWAVLFLGSHVALSSGALRPVLVRALGAQGFRGLYSAVAFATLIPLILVFARHKHAGPMLWYLRDMPPIRWLVWLLMLVAFILLVGSFISPNPGAIGARSNAQVRGMLKITRHGFFVAIVFWGIAHMLMNGWAGDVIFFGSLAALAIIGGRNQDQRKLKELGASYRALLAETSFTPFAALISGRQRWTGTDMPWAAIVVGAITTVVILMIHPMLFGGNALG